jgi:ACS family hexuronate transporter-like MFS transporter
MTFKLPEADSSEKPPIAGWRWLIVWLMFLATMLAYMDRQTLGSTAAYIKAEFQLTEEDYGWIESWFGVAFALFQIPAGLLADRINVRWLYAGALLIWSAAGFATGMAETVTVLMISRVVLGIGESFNWPCAVGIVRRVIPLESRGLANGIFHSGASIGAVATPIVALWLVGPKGENWRLLFQVVGAGGLIWTALWLWCVRGGRAAEISQPQERADNSVPSETAGHNAEDATPFFEIFLTRRFWIAMVVAITVNICWHFYRVWLPRFLNVDLKFSQQQIQWILIGFFLAADLGSMLGGYTTRRLAYTGWSVPRSRSLVLLGGSLLCLLSTPAALLLDPWITVPLMFVVAAGSMAGFPIFFALAQDISPRHTSLFLGIFGCSAWLVLFVLHPPIGALVDRIGTFVPSLIAVGCVPLVGAIVCFFWPEPVKLPAVVENSTPYSEAIQAAPKQ